MPSSEEILRCSAIFVLSLVKIHLHLGGLVLFVLLKKIMDSLNGIKQVAYRLVTVEGIDYTKASFPISVTVSEKTISSIPL